MSLSAFHVGGCSAAYARRLAERVLPGNRSGPLFHAVPAAMLLLALTSLLYPAVAIAEAGAVALEYQVKAVYVYNFLKFVDWPAGTFDGPSDPIDVCVAGQHPISKALSPIERQAAKDRPIRLHRLAAGEPHAQCELLFIGTGDRRRTEALVERLAGEAVLTVSDLKDFIDIGGMIGFVIEDGRVLLEINLRRLRAANLSISAKVLEIASNVVMD